MTVYGAISIQNQQDIAKDDADYEKNGVVTSVLRFFGFHSNPLQTSQVFSASRNQAATDMRLAMLSSFSTDYNVVSISLALHIIETLNPGTSTANTAICSSALLAGMIFGQVAGGTLGDILGRHAALTVVMTMQIVAAFMSGLSISIDIGGTHIDMFTVLALWRFILGVGCGGVYPLAATLTAESRKTSEDRPKSVALTFSMQGVGFLFVAITAYVLLLVLGSTSHLTWRLLLGLGAVPGIFVTFARRQHQRDTKGLVRQDTTATTETTTEQLSLIEAVKQEDKLVRKLLGTAGTWFLFDICFYGNTLFQPLVLTQAFGTKETLLMSARDTGIVASLALPGYFVSVYMLGRQSPRYIQLQGFFLMAVVYAIIGVGFHGLANIKWLLLILYASTFFFSNYGPNSTTFMLPSMTFSKPCRTTLNGVAAACGKIGALLGASLFVPFSIHYGDNAVMLSCAGLSLVGYILTWFNVDEHLEHNLEVVHEDESDEVNILYCDEVNIL